MGVGAAAATTMTTMTTTMAEAVDQNVNGKDLCAILGIYPGGVGQIFHCHSKKPTQADVSTHVPAKHPWCWPKCPIMPIRNIADLKKDHLGKGRRITHIRRRNKF